MFSKFARKALCFIMCLSIAAASAGCESRRPKQEQSPDESSSVVIDQVDSTTPEENVQHLDDLGGKYKGKTFKIVATNDFLFKANKTVGAEGKEEAQSPLEKAVDNRISTIKSKLGLEKVTVEVVDSEKDLKTDLRAAVEKGEPYADLICASASLMAELAEEGLLENIRSLPYMDWDATYMPKETLAQQTAGGKLYFFAGDATLSLNTTSVLFYNKEILDKAGLKPVGSVLNGDFTWDSVKSMANTAADMGYFGIDSALNSEELMYSVYASTGNLFLTPSSERAEISYNHSAAYAINGINTALFENTQLVPNRDVSADPAADAIRDFKNGKTAFLVARLDSVVAISQKVDGQNSNLTEWGVLPLPKLEESQLDYVAPVNGISYCLAVPKETADSAFAGFMLNAFLAASTNGLDEALKTTYINYYFWNNDSALMLNLIEESLSYDLGIMYSSLPQVYDVATRLLISDDNLTLKPEDENYFYEFSDRLFG